MKASRGFKPQYGLAGHNVALWEIEVERELCVLHTLASFGHCVLQFIGINILSSCTRLHAIPNL